MTTAPSAARAPAPPGPVGSAELPARSTDAPRATPGGLNALAVALLGLVLGLAATAVVVGRGLDPGAVAIGPWVTRPRVGSPAIDPYARADLARTGAVPLAANVGLSFTATTDDTGYRLLRTCSYRIGGAVPAARAWTLTATDRDGRLLDNPAARSAFTSSTVVRDIAGGFAVVAAPAARPGNWLPLSGEGPLTLTLRLYDTTLSSDPGRVASAALPVIERLSCTSGADGG